jgi:hypothetical protein
LGDLRDTGQTVSFPEEQTWLERVHSHSERAFLESLNVGERQSRIFEAVSSKTYGSAVRELVREIAEVPAFDSQPGARLARP